MNAVCYFCDKQSTDSGPKIAETKSQHTQTPTIDFIRQFLGDFHSARNVDDESNCICVECLKQINDYDWMRQQVSEQETKLRDLLLATEIILCVKSDEPVGIEGNEDNYNHNGIDDVFQNDIEDMTSTTTITTTTTNPTAITSPLLQFPKPTVSYRYLIAMALKNSRSGALLPSEIYSFISEHFPYFKTAVEDWKSTIRSALTSQESFLKRPQTNSGLVRINYKNVWTMNPSNIVKWDKKIQKCLSECESNVLSSMAIPENLPALMRGEMKHGRIHGEESVESNCSNDTESHSSDFQPTTKRTLDDALASDAVLQNDNEILVSTTTISTHLEEFTSPILQYPKPFVSYRCLIAMALKNSRSGSLLTSEIFCFICEHFPYYRTATEDWKGGMRSILSLQESFLKTGSQINSGRSSISSKNLWTMNPLNTAKLDEEIQKCSSECESNVLSAMAIPGNLPALMRGEMKHGRIHSEESMPALGAEPIQAESHSSDSHFPARKRLRNHIESSVVAPTSTSGNTTSTASNSQLKTGLKYARPSFTYACLIAMALKNFHTGSLLSSEIFSFISEHFPYYQTATENWRSGLRCVLSSNQFFVKAALQISGGTVKTSSENIWTINPTKIAELDERIEKCGRMHEKFIHRIMAVPEDLPALLKGELKHGGRNMMHSEWDSSSHPAPNEPVSVQHGTETASPTLNQTSNLNEPILQLQSKSKAIASKPLAERKLKLKCSYRHLIGIALRNSDTGSLPLDEIYSFICNNFPYFKTATNHWKNNVQSTLSVSSFFEKTPGKTEKDHMWTVKPSKVAKMEIEIRKLSQNNPITNAIVVTANECGEIRLGCLNGSYIQFDDTDDSESEHEQIDLISNSEDSIEAVEIFDDIEIDDSKSLQFELNAQGI